MTEIKKNKNNGPQNTTKNLRLSNTNLTKQSGFIGFIGLIIPAPLVESAVFLLNDTHIIWDAKQYL